MGLKSGFLTDYNPKTKESIFTDAVFRTVDGYPVNAKLGFRDYIIMGKAKEIKGFFDNRIEQLYTVTPQTIGNDGHWSDDSGQQVYLTIENVGPGITSVSSLVYAQLMSKVTKIFFSISQGAFVNELFNFLTEYNIVVKITDLVNELTNAGIDPNKPSSSPGYGGDKWGLLYKCFQIIYKKGDKLYTQKPFNSGEPMIITMTSFPKPETAARKVVPFGTGETPLAHAYNVFLRSI